MRAIPRSLATNFLAVPILVMGMACAALAAGPAKADAPDPVQLREYVRLFGYREMLADSAKRQLAALIDISRQSRPDVAPELFELIQKELESGLAASLDQAEVEMAEVLAKHFTREDVNYLVGVGRDPRMQRVVAKQPAIGADLEGVGERLAQSVAERAAPRIAERLRQLEGAQKL